MPLYLGLDASTQSLTGVVIEVSGSERRIAFQRSLEYDLEFPHYGTRGGVLPARDPLTATSSPVLWAEALDRFLGMLRAESGLPLAELRAVSGAAQQHGSVYCNGAASRHLAHLDPARPLAGQVAAMLSRPESPIWMDSSTAAECAEISQAVGGAAALARLTGSRAFERFTGPQIRRYWKTDPTGYAATDRIHLVSSFLASLLIGGHAPVEPGDAAGMNLMDLARASWAPAALNATAPDLARRLPPIVPSRSAIGRLARYWTERHGLPPARVVAWTGDNPSSLIGVGLVSPTRVAISLGTSDTVFGLLDQPRVDPSGASHVFGAPTGGYLGLVCFRNGARARERVRDGHGLGWDGFAGALRRSPPGNRGGIMLPWFEAEITPPVLSPRVHRYGVDQTDPAADVRGLIEGQMMAMARHSRWMGQRVRAIHATGGGSQSREVLQVMADVHNADVYQLPTVESAALGAALRAWHGDEAANGRDVAWDDVVAGLAEPSGQDVVRPDPGRVKLYAELMEVHAACEAHVLGSGADPAPLIQRFRQRCDGVRE
jgi:xylulokinase